ncbi:hypothetical protein [Rugosimonospora acidiphila]
MAVVLFCNVIVFGIVLVRFLLQRGEADGSAPVVERGLPAGEGPSPGV